MRSLQPHLLKLACLLALPGLTACAGAAQIQGEMPAPDPAAAQVESVAELDALVRDAAALDALPVVRDGVLVIVNLPPWGGRRVDVVYGDHRQIVPLDGAGTGTAAFPQTDAGFVRVLQRAEGDDRYGEEICRYPADRVDAGVLEVHYAYEEGADEEDPGVLRGSGTFSQWPAVTWTSVGDSTDTLPTDLLFNGRTVGSTDLTRVVRPNRQHRCIWRRPDGTQACATDIRLPGNVRRTYVCDVATGEVHVQ